MPRARSPRPANPAAARPEFLGVPETPQVVQDPAPPLAPDPEGDRVVHVRYDGPSGVLVSSDNGVPVEFRQGEITRTTVRHLAHLGRVLPDHSLTTVKPQKE